MHTSTDTVFTKIAAQNVQIFKQITASARADFSVPEINALVAELIDIRAAKEAATSDKAARIARMSAAKSDPKMVDIIATVDKNLKRLGFAAGVNNDRITLKSLSEAMAADGMSETARFTLKDGCYACGVI